MTEALSHTMQAPPSIKHMLERVNLVQEVLAHVMKKDIHYGASFPGDTKLNLLKPGADALGVAFQFYPEFEVKEIDHNNGHREYRTDCRIKLQSDGRLIAMGVGTCSTLESKYRYRNAALKCPACGKEAIIKGKIFDDGTGGGWYCFDKKGGCKAKYKDGDPKIEKQERGKIENPDPADVWNTCLKISKKRAFVDASITATGASDMFTQDAEDIAENLDAQKKKDAKENPEKAEADRAHAAAEAPQVAPAEAKVPAPVAAEAEGTGAKHPRVLQFKAEAAKLSTRDDLLDLYEAAKSLVGNDQSAHAKLFEIRVQEAQRIKGAK